MKSGAFQVSCGAIVQLRRGDILKEVEKLSVGILAGAPSPEGLHEEVSWAGYERQPVLFEPLAKFARQLRSRNNVSFSDGSAIPSLFFVGLFDGSGRLIAGGRPRSCAALFEPNELRIPPGGLTLRLP